MPAPGTSNHGGHSRVAKKLELRPIRVDLDIAERRDEASAPASRAFVRRLAATTSPEAPSRPGDRDHGDPLAFDRFAENSGSAGTRSDPLSETLHKIRIFNAGASTPARTSAFMSSALAISR
jgi:hypothetical protein